MKNLRKHLSNVFGWTTKRKIVVIESDDWGSVRTASAKAYAHMLRAGLAVDASNFTRYDALESNKDLESLFEVLSQFQDSTGRPPVFTPMCVVANPDFKKIKASNFEQYFYEPFTETCQDYPEHDRVHELWLKGIEKRLFVPQLHGREHLHVKKWMKALHQNNEGMRIAFSQFSFGASHFQHQALPEYLAAFDLDAPSDMDALNAIFQEGAILFKKLCGYSAKHFIASNSPEPKQLELICKKQGIQYLTRYKHHLYPLGNGKYTRAFNWLGKRNNLAQIYLTRNASFEPSDFHAENAVDQCLQDIAIAFRWNKPAIISSHRVNYVGYIDQSNREKGLKQLEELIKKIIHRWPEVEFMTSVELGDLISDN